MSNQDSNRELLAAYTVLDGGYKNAVLRYVAGEAAGDALDITGAIDSPATAVGVPSVAVGADDDPDPELFSFTVPVSGGDPLVRILLVKVSTPTPGGTSTGRYSVLDPHDPPSGTWTTLARDVYLTDGTNRVAGNPHAVAQAGNTLYIIEYDTRKIWPLGIHELDGQIGEPTVDHPLAGAPIDLGVSPASLPADAKGQDLIYLKNGDEDEYLFALYQRPQNSSASSYYPSVLVRLKKNAASGLFEFNGKASVGPNAQSIIPVWNGSGAISLLIPAIGGEQQGDGTTNETASTIHKADPFAATFTATGIVTGDAMPPSGAPATFDIAAIAAQAANNGVVYILTFTFAADYTELNWKLYKTTANQLLNIIPIPQPPTLSSLEGNVLTLVISATTLGIDGYGGLSFWDILYENGTAAAADRLWFRKDGIEIHSAQNYPTIRRFAPGLGFGQTGGDNINAFDLVAETIRQAKAGVSLKRGFKAVKVQAAAEEEEEK